MTSKRLVITGALANVFGDCDELYIWDREKFDITDRDAVLHMIGGIEPDIIINAATYTAVDRAEEETDRAECINGNAVGHLAAAAMLVGAKLVHYSTDYVFAGDKENGYDESFSGYDPVKAYGKSKLLGERTLTESEADHYLIRTSWLYGPGGKNFVETMLWLADKIEGPGDELDELKVISDQFGKPTYTKDLAEATREILEGELTLGVYHVSNEVDDGKITWHDFAVAIFELAGRAVVPRAIPTEEYTKQEKRPSYSMLINTKMPARRDWKVALREYLVEREED